MIYDVSELDLEEGQPILIRLRGEDLKYIAMNGTLSFQLDDKTADSIAFHIQSILQDRDLRGKK